MAQTGDELGYYYVEDYIETGYYDYEPYIQDGYVTANYFQEEGVVHLASATLLVASNASDIATAGVIKSTGAVLNGVFAPSIFAAASRNSSIDMALQTGFAVNNQRTRSSDVTLANIVNLSLQSARIRDTQVFEIPPVFNLIPIASRTTNTTSSLAISFEQTANATRIKQSTATLTSVFSPNIQATASLNGSTDIHVQTTASADLDKIRQTSANLNSAFALSTVSAQNKSTGASITAGTTVTAELDPIKSTGASITTNTTVTADATRIQQGNLALNSAFAQNAVVNTIAGAISDTIYPRFEIVTQVTNVKQLASDLTAFASTLAAAGKVGDFFVDVDLQTTMVATANLTKSTTADFNCSSLLGTLEVVDGIGTNTGSANTGVIKSTSATLAVNTATSIVPNRRAALDPVLQMIAQFTQSDTTVGVIMQGQSNLAATTQLGNSNDIGIGANAGIIPNFESSSISVDTAISATATAVKSAQANPTANFNLASDGDTLIQGVLASEFTMSVLAQQTFGRPNTWVASNPPTVFSTTAKFGTHSLSSTIQRNYISSPNSAFAFGEDDFTIEAWVRPSSLPYEQNVFLGSYDSLAGSTGYLVTLMVTSDNRLKFVQDATFGFGNFDTSKNFTVETASLTVTDDAWNHVAVTRVGRTYSLYVNGSRLAQITNSFDTDYQVLANSIQIVAADNFLIDEHRISRFVARYTGSTYTVPTQQFVNDANTTNLLHLDNSLLDDYGAVTAFLNTTATLTAEGGKLLAADSNLSTQTTLAATATRTASATAEFTGFASTLSDVEVIPPLQLPPTTLATTASLTATARVFSLQDVTASLSSLSSLDAHTTLKSALNGVLTTTSTVVATAGITKTLQGELAGTTALTATPINVEQVTAEFEVECSLTVSSTVDYVSPSANLAVSSKIELLFIDTKRYVYQIPNESRKYTIHPESRKFAVDTETRSYTIGDA